MNVPLPPLASLNISIQTGSGCDKYPAKQHAQRVARLLGADKGLIFLASGEQGSYQDSDIAIPFRVRRYFYYLSGVDEPSCELIYNIASDELVLRVPPRRAARDTFFNGEPLTPSEALERYDFDEVLEPAPFLERIKKWFASSDGAFYVLHLSDLPKDLQHLQNKYFPRFNFHDLLPSMNTSRGIKDGHEIRLIKKANEISGKAHRAVLANLLKFDNESEIENLFLFICRANRAKWQAYEPIAGAGRNAATLHYIANNQPFAKDRKQLVCMDAGCEWDRYAADITRTFPVSGYWPSEEAEQIYYLVDTMQRFSTALLKPGAKYRYANFLAHDLLVRGFLKLGIFQNGTAEEILNAGTSLIFLPHGLGHHMGLEVHDVAGESLMARAQDNVSDSRHLPPADADMLRMQPSVTEHQTRGLQPGMVVTVEPGIYFNVPILEESLRDERLSKFVNRAVLNRYIPVGGVRIEDDILITESGHENLTDTPKGSFALKIIRGEVDENAVAPRESAPIVTAENASKCAMDDFESRLMEIRERWQRDGV